MRIRLSLLLAIVICSAAFAQGGTTIDAAKQLSDGAPVRLEGKVATVGGSDFRKILPQFQAGVSVGSVQTALINEASGIAASRRNADVLWVHNDSGDTARVFPINTTGRPLGIYNLSGATATDWEDIAVGPGPVPGQHYIYAGDIGDNNAVRGTIAVYRVTEPAVSSTQQPVTVTLTGVEKFTLRYEDGARDAETLMVDPVTGDLYIVSKRDTNSRVYRAAKAELTTSGTVVLHRVATLPWGWAVGGDISPDGSEIIIKGYSNASLWRRSATGNMWNAFSGTAYTIPVASEPQGEAIGFDRNGRDYYTISEGVNPPLYRFARVADQSCAFFYVQEPGRWSGIRVAKTPGDVSGLTRGSLVTVDAWLGTTSSGERQLANPIVTITGTSPALPLPIGFRGRDMGGGDLGNPAGGLGQYGPTGGSGPNNIGLLAKAWGRVTYKDPAGSYLTIDDGSGAPVRIDTSLIYTSAAVNDYLSIRGLVSLYLSGTDRIRLLIPRSDSDLSAL